jgi:hypothetical protein
MSRVASVDDYLTGHVGLFLKLYKMTHRPVASIRLAENGPSTTLSYVFALANIDHNRNPLLEGFLTSAAHAACARTLKDKLILGRIWWKRFLPKKYNQSCLRLLTKGKLDEPLEKFTNG